METNTVSTGASTTTLLRTVGMHSAALSFGRDTLKDSAKIGLHGSHAPEVNGVADAQRIRADIKRFRQTKPRLDKRGVSKGTEITRRLSIPTVVRTPSSARHRTLDPSRRNRNPAQRDHDGQSFHKLTGHFKG
jgi:hypothetical protein